MRDQKKFNDIEELLNDKNILFARKELNYFRKDLDLDPDYLFLMSKLLLLDNRPYLSIDTVILSIFFDTQDNFLAKKNFIKSNEKTRKKKRLLLIELSTLIFNKELERKVLEIANDNALVEHLFDLMPGLRPKKFKKI